MRCQAGFCYFWTRCMVWGFAVNATNAWQGVSHGATVILYKKLVYHTSINKMVTIWKAANAVNINKIDNRKIFIKTREIRHKFLTLFPVSFLNSDDVNASCIHKYTPHYIYIPLKKLKIVGYDSNNISMIILHYGLFSLRFV